jgi:hypothetical protein
MKASASVLIALVFVIATSLARKIKPCSSSGNVYIFLQKNAVKTSISFSVVLTAHQLAKIKHLKLAYFPAKLVVSAIQDI